MVTATGSTVPRSSNEPVNTIANVLDYGAIGDGVANDTAARSRPAVATGKQVYMPPPVRGLPRHQGDQRITQGQVAEGDGKAVPIIAVGNDFNLGALGVFVMRVARGCRGRSSAIFRSNFAQPDCRDLMPRWWPIRWRFTRRASRGRRGMGIKINAGDERHQFLRLNGAGTSILVFAAKLFDWHIYLDKEADSVLVQSCRFENEPFNDRRIQNSVYHASSVGIILGQLRRHPRHRLPVPLFPGHSC